MEGKFFLIGALGFLFLIYPLSPCFASIKCHPLFLTSKNKTLLVPSALQLKLTMVRPLVNGAHNARALELTKIPRQFIPALLTRKFEDHLQDRSRSEALMMAVENPPQSQETIRKKRAAFAEIVDYFTSLRRAYYTIPSPLADILANNATFRASSYWKSLGISHTVIFIPNESRTILMINPQGSHPVNQFTRHVMEEHGLDRITYDPQPLLEHGYAAAYIDESQPPLLIGHNNALNLTIKDLDLLHELRHSSLPEKLRQRVSLPYYGISVAIKGILPWSSLFDPYSLVVGHDEMDTYFHSLKQLFILLTGSLKEMDHDKISTYTKKFASFSSHGLHIS
ncbi:MAG: hypothetical protein WCG27_05960, partial [Pseudomonadota bacterium]